MSVLLEDQLNYLDDFRQDTSSDTVDINTEGIRALNFIINFASQHHFWEFTQKRVRLDYFDGIQNYPLESNYLDMKGVYDLTNFFDPTERVSPINFKRLINIDQTRNLIADEYDDGVSKLRLYLTNTLSDSTDVISNASFNGNGTWVATGGASAVATDNKVYLENSGAVRFKLNGSSNGILTNADLSSSVDISSFGVDYTKFFKLILSAAITSVTWRWGSTSSAYHEVTQTKQYDGRAFVAGVNEVGFPLLSSTDTGSPSDSAIDWLQLEIASSNSCVVRFSTVTAKTPHPLEFRYYSNDFIFDNGTSAWVTKFDGNDPANDYGAWSGRYDWFADVINTGAVAVVLKEMQEDELAADWWRTFAGGDRFGAIGGSGGMFGEAKNKLPARVKKIKPPSLVPDVEGIDNRFPAGEYYD